MSDNKDGNGHGGPTEEEKARIKEVVLKKFEEIQKDKKKDDKGGKK